MAQEELAERVAEAIVRGEQFVVHFSKRSGRCAFCEEVERRVREKQGE